MKLFNFKKKYLKINETFSGIQGEGKYQGYPVLFIRLSGCTRKCSFCDTKYHIKNEKININILANKIMKANKDYVVWTGGEPLLQIKEIKEAYDKLLGKNIMFHLETNGDLISGINYIQENLHFFNYTCVSPKEEDVARKIHYLFTKYEGAVSDYDIKVVTDLDKVGIEMVKYATSLMPLSTYNPKKDKEIRQRVWDYCVKNNLFYSARLHVEVWKKTKGK